MAIARDLGIIQDASEAITGAELDAIPDEEMRQAVPLRESTPCTAGAIRLYKITHARTAPSIKERADIGVGITGTDVTKNVGGHGTGGRQLSAPSVAQWRKAARIYDNIRKAIQFLLGFQHERGAGRVRLHPRWALPC